MIFMWNKNWLDGMLYMSTLSETRYADWEFVIKVGKLCFSVACHLREIGCVVKYRLGEFCDVVCHVTFQF